MKTEEISQYSKSKTGLNRNGETESEYIYRRPKTKWWLIAYTIAVVLLEVYTIVDDFVDKDGTGYGIALGVWTSLICVVAIFGNVTYALNRVTPALQKAWRRIPLLFMADIFLMMAVIILENDDAIHQAAFGITLVVIIAGYYPTLLVNYRIASKPASYFTGITT